ncbi:metal ABC transporter permease [Actinotignum timonense]|uniref:metal ABC transporter permease n=1 Tax=Actinotignum TaxID=1653174 RepID=UPI00254C1F0C|nr:metal ABC transporter permease [Actinotignum timonense]MDK6589949.1 metal ABC transporter permease [Actinotignum timonense]MDK6628817.1 metal ABC transporter permease [Actinotignum timonense]MDK6906334.1 metal ABC transporter permease [Actinotignum timonense]MDK8781924.1 metal ABC transporter permease [Actinotignum timonense]MDY5138653.1 metal ABC transporter permease [Actinotignum timonense]
MIDFISPLELWGTYIFRTMLIGTTLIGVFSGIAGCLLYLRRQSLVSDVIGHSSILGVVAAFTVATLLGMDGRSMVVLVLGASAAAMCAVVLTNIIVAHSKVKADAAMAICLSLFYGGGMVCLRLLTHSHLPNRGGIDSYMFGNAANVRAGDLVTIAVFGLLTVAVILAFFKEIKLVTFDPVTAQLQGFSPRVLTPLMLVLVTIAIVIGIKGVGLILMVAFAIMPAAAARQWTHRMSSMMVLAGIFGGVAGAAGAYLSVCLGKVPTGPIVVLHLFVIFAFSLLAAPRRSIVVVALRQRRLRGDLATRALASAEVPVSAGAPRSATTTAPAAPEALAAGGASERSGQ